MLVVFWTKVADVVSLAVSYGYIQLYEDDVHTNA